MLTPLQLAHSWIYQSLVADTFIFTNNEVKLRNGEGVAKSYSLTEQGRFALCKVYMHMLTSYDNLKIASGSRMLPRQ